MNLSRLTALAMVLLLLAGCASKDTGGSSRGPHDGSTTSSTTFEDTFTTSLSTTSVTDPPQANAAPVVSIGLSVAAGAAPLSTNVTVTGSDADGDTLTGTLSFGDGTQGTPITAFPFTVAHTFSAAGNYTVVAMVSDARNSVNATATVTVTAPGGSLRVEDPAGDAETDYTDILTVEPNKTADSLTVVMGVDTVWPVALGASPVGYGLTINGGVFRCYAYQTTVRLWDVTAVAYVAAEHGSCTWDTTANTVTIQLTLAYLADTDGFVAPFEVSAASFEGGIAQNLGDTGGADLTDDLAPDTGVILVP